MFVPAGIAQILDFERELMLYKLSDFMIPGSVFQFVYDDHTLILIGVETIFC